MKQGDIIICWLEASIVAFGAVNTNQVVDIFGIARPNAAIHVKRWQELTDLAEYSAADRAFVRKTGRWSKIFLDKKEALSYIKSVEKLMTDTRHHINSISP